jgi:transcriptional regulator with XRE-family HTH domain
MTDITSPNPADLTAYGAAIRMARERAGKRQGEFANEIEISGTHLSNIEAGRRRPSPAVFWRIANALNINDAERWERVAS